MSKFSIRERIKSFGYAFSGIGHMLRYEHNAWIHTIATIVVVAAGIYLKLSTPEWICIIFAIGIVFIAEAINTAIEQLANAISLAKNKSIQKAKDVAAGAVLIAAIIAATVGLIVFIPHISSNFQ